MRWHGTLSVFSAILLAACGSAVCQSVVDNSNCEDHGLNCPTKDDPSYKKYCCLESDGGNQLYSCCNPYLGLIIGVSVGVPIIILIVVAVVIAYCICHYYHNRKMRSLMATYQRRRREEERRRRANLLAPPPYTALLEEDSNLSLPVYTVDDPFATTAFNSAADFNDETNEEEGPPQLEGVADESGAARDHNASSSSSSSSSSTSDHAPLIEEDKGE